MIKINMPLPIASRITDEQVEDLLAHLLRLPAVTSYALDEIDSSRHFRDTELENAVVWAAAQDVVLQHGLKILPASNFQSHLVNAIADHLADADVNHGVRDNINDLLEAIYDRPIDSLDEGLGYQLLKQFLHERKVSDSLLAFPAGQCVSNPTEHLNQLLNESRRIDGIGDTQACSLGDEWLDHEKHLAARRGRPLIGLKTGLAKLDARMLGLRRLGTLGAGPGVGKTALAIELALGVCRHHAENDAVVVFVSLDMPRYELYSRIKCNLSDLEWSALTLGPNSEWDERDFTRKLHKADEQAKQEQIKERLAVVDRDILGENITADRLARILKDAKQRVGATRGLLILDYLQILPLPESIANRSDLEQDRYRIRIMQQLVDHTKTAENPEGDAVLFISETRKPDKSQRQWGDALSELMGSARLAYAVDYAIFYKHMQDEDLQKYYGTSKSEAVHKRAALERQAIAPITLSLEKGRDGMMKGSWGMEFQFKKSRFTELTPLAQPEVYEVPEDEDDEDDGQDDGELVRLCKTPSASGKGEARQGRARVG